MPQVDAVGDLADVDEHRVAEGLRQAARPGGHHAEDDHGHGDGDGELAAGEQEAGRPVEPAHRTSSRGQGRPAEHLGAHRRVVDGSSHAAIGLDARAPPALGVAPAPGGCPARRCRPTDGSGPAPGRPVGHRSGQRPPVPGPHGQADGQRRADQDVLAPGVGALVEAGDRRRAGTTTACRPPRPAPRPRRRPAPATAGGRGGGAGRGGGGPGPPAATRCRTAPRWPATTCGTAARAGREGEVVRAAHDEVPVGHVEQRRQRIEPQGGELARGGEEVGVGGHADEQQQEGGQQAPGPPGPELHRAGW